MSEKSKVWQYFIVRGTGVHCNLCNSCISQGSDKTKNKNTSNLWSHLRSHHKEKHDGIQPRKMVPSKRTHTAVPDPDFFSSTRKWHGSDSRAKKLDRHIAEMIATDNQPFTMVEEPGFQRLLATAEPRYSIKSEKFYRTEELPSIYERVEKSIKEILVPEKAGSGISFTTDCWSGTTESLMSLTAHFVDENWNRKQVVLNVKAMKDSHTGEYIARTFDSMLSHWGIAKERVFLVLRDGGANMVKGLRLADVGHLSCFAHALQLVVNDAIKSQQVVKDVLAKFRSIATHFRHSVLAQQRLRAIQKSLDVELHSILQSVPTRWNSNLTMLERMIEQKRALALYATEHGQISMLSTNEWEISEKLVATLKPFEHITKDISEESASISVIIPSFNVLKMLLEATGAESRGIRTMRKEMLDSLTRRFGTLSLNECKPVVIACLLDPRYKDRPFDASMKARAKEWILEELGGFSSSAEESAGPSAAEQPSSRSAVDAMFATLLGDMEQSGSVTGPSQLDQYILEPVLDRKKTNPIEWWRQNKERFPLLATAAKKFLAAPPTSVPSERVFSTVGQIFTDRRGSLHGENAEKLCFLNYNLRLLNWKY